MPNTAAMVEIENMTTRRSLEGAAPNAKVHCDFHVIQFARNGRSAQDPANEAVSQKAERLLAAGTTAYRIALFFGLAWGVTASTLLGSD